MSKQDYQAIAAIINLSWKTSFSQNRIDILLSLIDGLTSYFKRNPKFDEHRFVEACTSTK